MLYQDIFSRFPSSSNRSFRYYDPVNRYEPHHSHPSVSPLRDDYVDSDAGSGRYPRMTSSLPVAELNSSYHPHSYPSREQITHSPYSQPSLQYSGPSAMSYPSQQPVGSYINLRGASYDVDGVLPDDTQGYIANTGGGAQYPGYPAPGNPVHVQYPQVQGYPTQYVTTYPEEGYGISSGPFVEPNQGFMPAYEEDFSASNLLLSPAYTEPVAYSYPEERQIPYQSMGRLDKKTDSKSDLKPTSETFANARDDADAPSEKLSTIKEIDADEVVAKIDELLL